MAMEIAGKLALVTGASSGIGAATARALAGKGARVILVARSGDRLAQLAREIEAAGGSALAIECDLSSSDEISRMGEQVLEKVGTPDILINNAGSGRWLPTVETTPREARQMIELPYLAAFDVTRVFLPRLLAAGNGHIVNVTSPASYMVWPNAAAYIAARQALKGFSDALRTEVEAKGVFVSLVVLGVVESSYWEHNPGSREHASKAIPPLTTDQAADAIIKAIERRKRRLVSPAIFRAIFLLRALFS
jgi:uncharacterized protein